MKHFSEAYSGVNMCNKALRAQSCCQKLEAVCAGRACFQWSCLAKHFLCHCAAALACIAASSQVSGAVLLESMAEQQWMWWQMLHLLHLCGFEVLRCFVVWMCER